MKNADKEEKPPSETRHCYVENNQSGTVGSVCKAFWEIILLAKPCTFAWTDIGTKCLIVRRAT